MAETLDLTPTLPPVVGKYEIAGLLGRGAMGVVYRAWDTVLHRDVALKVMSEGFGEDRILRARFEKEAQAAARLAHPNIVTVFELGYHGRAPFIVMELLKGQDLSAAIARQSLMTLDQKLHVFVQVLAGLSHAHRSGVVHRDVKPANIFLLDDGLVKLLDFGTARLTQSGTTKAGGGVFGTADYMSPEQVKGLSVDGRSDVFSAGCVLFELVAGGPPFHADNIVTVIYRILNEDPDYARLGSGRDAEALAAVVRRALARSRDERFATAYDFATALRSAPPLAARWGGPPKGARLFDEAYHLEVSTLEEASPPSSSPRSDSAPQILADTVDLRSAATLPPPPPRIAPPPRVRWPWLAAAAAIVVGGTAWASRFLLPGVDSTTAPVAAPSLAPSPLASVSPLLVPPASIAPGAEALTERRASATPSPSPSMGSRTMASPRAAAAGRPPITPLPSPSFTTARNPADGPGRENLEPAPSTSAPAFAATPSPTPAAPTEGSIGQRSAVQIKGWVTDARCKEMGARPDHWVCAQRCVRDGYQPLFASGGKLYSLVGLDRILGDKNKEVTVSGFLDSIANTFTVAPQ